MSEQVKNVHEIMDEMVKRPTLDQLLDRHPSTLKFPEDYVPHVDELRRQRAMFIKSEQEKKAGKDKYKMPDTTEETDDAASET